MEKNEKNTNCGNNPKKYQTRHDLCMPMMVLFSFWNFGKEFVNISHGGYISMDNICLGKESNRFKLNVNGKSLEF